MTQKKLIFFKNRHTRRQKNKVKTEDIWQEVGLEIKWQVKHFCHNYRQK